MFFMKIYGKEISYEKKGLIIDSVRAKKDLVNLDTGFILEHMQKFLEQNTPVPLRCGNGNNPVIRVRRLLAQLLLKSFSVP